MADILRDMQNAKIERMQTANLGGIVESLAAIIAAGSAEGKMLAGRIDETLAEFLAEEKQLHGHYDDVADEIKSRFGKVDLRKPKS